VSAVYLRGSNCHLAFAAWLPRPPISTAGELALLFAPTTWRLERPLPFDSSAWVKEVPTTHNVAAQMMSVL
jgi:hypothetical protein